MCDDRETVCEMIRIFLEQYPTTLAVLREAPAADPLLADEIHDLRSLFGLFSVDAGLELVIELDRQLTAGETLSEEGRNQLVALLQALAGELEAFLTR